MKLIIQIPCYNEEATLGLTLSKLPRKLAGVDAIEWLVIDDGSADRTVEVAKANNADHVIRLPNHQGLAKAFMAGIEESFKRDADIIVNTDGDNQYCADDIQKLIEPILSGKAEFVIGVRPIAEIKHFSLTKKILQKIGSSVVRVASKTEVPDVTSGFRAISRDAAMRLNVFDEYTYSLETIIQAGRKGIAVTYVPVRTNADQRPSRLIKSIPGYIRQSVVTIIRIFMTYKPFMFFAMPGALVFTGGMILAFRFLFYFFSGAGSGHVQSLLLSALLLGVGFFLIVVGMLADLISYNRKLLENIDYRVKKIEEDVKGRESNIL